jgi:drug/metabolite transporter (DMT)-like permease
VRQSPPHAALARSTPIGDHDGEEPVSGVVLGAMAGVGFGLFQAVNRQVNAAIDVYRATVGLLAVGTAMMVVVSVLTDDVGALVRAPPRAVGAFAVAGVVHFLLGWTFLGLSQQRLGAARTGAILGANPLLGALAAAVVLDEGLDALTLGALLIVVVGVVLVARSRREIHGGPPPSAAGIGFALATATCWAVSPLLIRAGLDGLSPVLGVTVGLAVTTVAYAMVLAVVGPNDREPLSPATRRMLGLAGVLVGLAIWSQWTALRLTRVAVVLALMQLSAPVVVIAAPVLSGDPMERGGPLLWLGLVLVVTGALTFLLGGG